VKSPDIAEICNPITRQAIELESYPYYPRIQQVSWSKSKKKFFVFGGGFLEGTSQRTMFWKLWPPLAGPGPQTIDPLFWLKVLLKTRSKSASIEPWIDLLAYL